MAPTKLSSWAAKRVGTLNRFYTRPEVGQLLTAELGPAEPRRVVDLGAGEGSLSSAVARRWPGLDVTTVDIDEGCVAGLQERLAAEGASAHRHCACDVLDIDLPATIGGGGYDLAVCNPPFYRPAWDRSFARILQAADFADACASVADCTAEILFFAQILRLLEDGGRIAFIVPDGLATGWRALNFRTALLERHQLKAVIQLPPYSFRDTEAYCFVLIVEKGKAQADAPIKLVRMSEDGEVLEPVWIDEAAARTRLDHAFHSAQGGFDHGFTLRELGAEIRRGALSTVDRRHADFPVFHTGDFPARGDYVALGNEVGSVAGRKLVVAEAGDILMARVDRELHDKIACVASGSIAITDCVYRIRLPAEHRARAFAALSAGDARQRIIATTKGVGARLIGKGDLLDLPLWLPSDHQSK
jgi:type I restriction enzyme M protein